jgi:hypothetical protein
VQAIGQLDEDDADVVDHRQQHLAEVFGLAFLARRKRDRADFGDPFDHVGDFGPEVFFDFSDGRQRVFDHIVEQAGGNRHRVEAHIRQDTGHLQWVHEVGLP